MTNEYGNQVYNCNCTINESCPICLSSQLQTVVSPTRWPYDPDRVERYVSRETLGEWPKEVKVPLRDISLRS